MRLPALTVAAFLIPLHRSGLSAAVCFAKPMTRTLTQEKVERLAQARFVFTNPSWKTVSAAGKEFVRGLLKKQPGFRWTAREALDHCADVWGPTFLVRNGRLSFVRRPLDKPKASCNTSFILGVYLFEGGLGSECCRFEGSYPLCRHLVALAQVGRRTLRFCRD